MSPTPAKKEGSPHYKFTTITGYFQHDSEPTGPSFRATTSPNLGLINRAYATDAQYDPNHMRPQWTRFEHYLNHLNQEAPNKAKYKVFYLARHGQGYHNVQESLVGRSAWEAHWSRLDANSEITWADAHLTDLGLQQARDLKVFWKDAFENDGIPWPARYYTSPLIRCLETVDATFSELGQPLEKPFRPVIKEGLRERFGVHTCDRRRSLEFIKSRYPEYAVEDGFTEEDMLWTPEVREPLDVHVNRMKGLLDDIFSNENGTFLSFTAHSGTCRALYLAIGHTDVWVAAGAVVPMLVRAESIESK